MKNVDNGDEKVALVTGAEINLGRVMALSLLEAGLRVVLTSLSRERLEEVVHAGNVPADRALIIAADLTKAEDRDRIVRESVDAFGRIDVLVNNAGVTPETYWPNWLVEGEPKPWELPQELYRTFLEVNTIAPHLLMAAVLPGMIERGWGRIVNITTSLRAMLTFWPYGSTKAALEAQTAVIARRLDGTGVTANVLVPGGLAKPEPLRMSGGRVIPPSVSPMVMAAPIRWLASEESNGFTGKRILGASWDSSLPPEKASQAACFPAGWDEPTEQNVNALLRAGSESPGSSQFAHVNR